jgi:hypothetical protein
MEFVVVGFIVVVVVKSALRHRSIKMEFVVVGFIVVVVVCKIVITIGR